MSSEASLQKMIHRGMIKDADKDMLISLLLMPTDVQLVIVCCVLGRTSSLFFDRTLLLYCRSHMAFSFICWLCRKEVVLRSVYTVTHAHN